MLSRTRRFIANLSRIRCHKLLENIYETMYFVVRFWMYHFFYWLFFSCTLLSYRQVQFYLINMSGIPSPPFPVTVARTHFPVPLSFLLSFFAKLHTFSPIRERANRRKQTRSRFKRLRKISRLPSALERLHAEINGAHLFVCASKSCMRIFLYLAKAFTNLIQFEYPVRWENLIIRSIFSQCILPLLFLTSEIISKRFAFVVS